VLAKSVPRPRPEFEKILRRLGRHGDDDCSKDQGAVQGDRDAIIVEVDQEIGELHQINSICSSWGHIIKSMLSLVISLMPIVLGMTLIGNIILSLVMLWRGYWVRYGWLLTWAILSVLADVFIQNIHSQHHSLYAGLLDLTYWLFIILKILVFFESWLLKNGRVFIPILFQSGMDLIAHVVHQTDFRWTYWYMECGLRFTNLLIIYWFILLFKEEPKHEPYAPHER
jgi:hypothetical protein